MKTVLRIEHEEGHYGPYCGKESIVLHADKHPLAKLSYEERKQFLDNARYRFGCSSPQKLVRWFNKEDRKTLHEKGYVVREYKVKGYEYDDGLQVIFDYNKAECVGCRPLRKNTSSPLVRGH